MKKILNSTFLISGLLLNLALSGCNLPPKNANPAKPVSESSGNSDNESLYQTNGKWDNQYGDTLTLSKLSGKIPVLAMVFTRCSYACPRIVADIQAIEKKIPVDKKDKVVFVLVSFDSERDHTKELRSFITQMKLNDKWLVLHGNSDDVRELSMLLNVKYKKQPDGDYTHSSGITLLDTKGGIVTQTEGIGKDPQDFISKIKLL